MVEDLRYPIGVFAFDGEVDEQRIAGWIVQVREAPLGLRAATRGLSEAQLDTPHREGGWTARQIAHHVPDSHLNAYVRFKLALTEDEPTIRPYDESRWAELEDGRSGSIEPSLALLEALHTRWDRLLRAMSPSDFERRFRHPEMGKLVPLGQVLALYAWHGRHHAAQIESLRARRGWR